MAQVLLFNFSGERRRRIRLLLIRLGIDCLEIQPKDFDRPLGALTGREGYDAPREKTEPFTGEMLVMDSLDNTRFHQLVDGLRRTRCPVPLKAIVTEHNLSWSPARLYRELAAEHAAMEARKGSIHGS